MANSVKGYRERRKMSQSKLSQETGVSQPLISMLEHSMYIPSLQEAERLAEILQTSVGALFSPEEIAAMREEESA